MDKFTNGRIYGWTAFVNSHIIVIDDEPIVVRTCTRMLEDAGFQVEATTDSREGLERLLNEPFDLALVDILMPGMNGLEVLRQASQQLPELALVMISGHGTLEMALKALRLGAQGFVLKPFTEEELLATVREVLARRTLRREHQRLRGRLPLLEIGQALVSGLDPTELAQRAIEVICREIHASDAALFLKRDEPGVWKLAGAKGKQPAFVRQNIEMARLLLNQAVEDQRPVYLVGGNDDNGPLRLAPDPGAAQVLLLPVGVPDRNLGILVLSRPPHLSPLTPDDIAFVQMLTRQVVIALENSRLFKETRRLKEFNENLVQNMSEGMVVEDAGGCFIFCNPAGAAMLGFTPQGVVGRHWTEVAHPDQHEIIRQANERRLRGESDRYELMLRRQDGSPLPVLVAGRPLFDEGGRFAGSQAVFSDLTEVKQLQTQLIQSEKLAALGRLVASLAHEINNPLQSLRSGLHLLLSRPVNKEKRQRYLELAGREVERLIALVGRVLEYYRPSSSRERPEPVEVNPLLDQVLTLAHKRLEHGRVTLRRQLAPDLPSVEAVGDQLKQVFLNLLLNALQAMPTGGELVTATGWNAARGEVWISFRDTGVGIPAEHLSHIFEPFYTTRSGGTGLGLAINYQIVERHNGRIEVKSQAGKGSVFTVCLPQRPVG